jgi:hypothetical protein
VNEIYPVDTVVVLRCGLNASIMQERSDDGFYLFYVHQDKVLVRLSEWNILTHISNPQWEDYGMQP